MDSSVYEKTLYPTSRSGNVYISSTLSTYLRTHNKVGTVEPRYRSIRYLDKAPNLTGHQPLLSRANYNPFKWDQHPICGRQAPGHPKTAPTSKLAERAGDKPPRAT